MLSEPSLKELTTFAESLAEIARGVLTAAHAQSQTAVEIKADGTPVTVADKECERLMRAAIQKAYPTHGILGEEFGHEKPEAEFCWVLDPIDGTKSFLARVPLYVTLIGLLYRGQPVLGIIDQPILKQRMVGDNQKTTLNGQPVRAQEVPLAQAVIVSSDLDHIRKYQPQAPWNALVSQVAYTRTWGDGYGYLLVASGRAHVMADPVVNPWDLIPVIPILRGAGAVVTDWKGGDARQSGNVLAAAPQLHAEVLRRLQP